MKTRQGFISNSSSSSFILRKSALTSKQHQKVKNFLEEAVCHSMWDVTEDKEFIYGDLEAHNNYPDTPAQLFRELIKGFGITEKDYTQKYEEYVGKEDLNED